MSVQKDKPNARKARAITKKRVCYTVDIDLRKEFNAGCRAQSVKASNVIEELMRFMLLRWGKR